MSTEPPQDTLRAALAWHAAGASVVRVATDGTKRPLGNWAAHQKERATEQQLRAWFAGGHPGLGIVCGAVSGGLEMLEFEGRAVAEGVLKEFGEIAEDSGLGGIWKRVAAGYLERSPSGGIHVLYRLDGQPVPGNTKLARRPARDDELTDDERQVLANKPGKVFVRDLVETRGEGGFVVVAPSAGPVHETGLPYQLLAGAPETLAVVTAEEREALHSVARTLDTMPAATFPAPADPAQEAFFRAAAPAADGSLKPGEDFEQRTDWTDILTPHGWRLLGQRGRTRYWQRPGKNGLGISATTGHADDRDRLFVFSSSTEFDPEHPYTKFAAHALLEHRGDYSGAAKELRRRGYGTAPERHLRTVPPPTAPVAGERPATEGSAALKRQADDGTWTAPEERRPLLPVPMPRRDWDDIGNAQRVVDRYGTEIRWITDTEQWAFYEAGRWVLKGANTGVWTRVVSTVDHLADEADNYSDEPPAIEPDVRPSKDDLLTEREKFTKWARGQRMRTKLAAAREVLQAHPAVHCTMSHFDRPEMLLNVANGIVDLKTGDLLAHSRDLYLMQQSPVRYDPKATCPQFEAFLDSVMPDPERRAYLARVVGYTITGSTEEQVMFIHHGDGQNGKGVFMRVMMELLGDYAQSVPRSTLLAKQSDGIPNDIARMMGKRLLSTTETSAGKKLDDELVKQLTGEDTMSARFMHAEFFDFRPVGKIHLATNYLPRVGGGHGIARRLQDIGWDVVVPPNKRIAKLDEKIMATEAAGVLNWAIRGCLEWQRDGLSVPEAVREKTREHLASSDPLAIWLEEETAEVPQGATETRLLYANYKIWSEASGLRPMSVTAFALALKERGIESGRDPRSRRALTLGVRLSGMTYLEGV
ncbi:MULTISPECIES: phage/plasmid primase, P4 family [Streptomyces]|uniref:Uncharacterized protein n=2 Tax=Streptomyces rimosus subsp. rimosus TaxID=132474 RepID=L8EY41_STRR1|nr:MULTISPECIES: phage/plasmid primase, P4 family [Streptomyces]MYT47338.1 hypothetical protein [Streptomyces sp. SID5471]KEF04668.1 hypothetical protein DF17_22535 [Streptomyces rimosus]KUJ29457.1 hypothetical protein ADK46_29470 [Streptomyces rimosus subsp. rimosus]QDA06253.1 hypothetical protein CTZ40_23330 [Streptomyces rimosus]QEV77529.1 hypothetical protein CP984_23295 [Streptomyces rimosus]